MARIAVIGAGMGGLACAGALLKAGHEVEVFERAQALSEVDSGLTLWSNGTLALQRLGVLDEVLRASAPLARLHVRRFDGTALMAIPTEVFSTPAVGAHRAGLQAALLSLVASSRIHLGASLAGVRETPGGVILEGSGHAAFDLAVAADGLRSSLRSYVCGEDSLLYKGYTIFRGSLESARPPLPGGLFTETWGPGLRLGLFPIGLGRWCWYAAVTQAPNRLLSREDLLRLFSDWAGPARELIAATPRLFQNDAYGRACAARWNRGRVVLIGDAAHPMAANLGQGACTTLEDAVALRDSLADARCISEALRSFEHARRRRVYGIAARASRIGWLAQWRDPHLCRGRDAVMRRIPGRWLTLASRSIHGYAGETGPVELRTGARAAGALSYR